MAQVGWTIDISRCVGCHTCTMSCQAENNTLEFQTGQANLAYRRVIGVEEGTYPEVSKYFLPMACHHCLEPACIPSCPVDAISKREEDGIVLIDVDACIGCGYCQPACPYGAPQPNVNSGKYEKCTFCVHRTSQGLEPACVPTCIGGALQFVRDDDFVDNGSGPPDFADPSLTRPAVKFL